MANWTAQDFENAIKAAQESGQSGSPHLYDAIAFAALRIASLVMKPGVLEAIVGEQFGRLAPPAKAWAIRKALTETTDV